MSSPPIPTPGFLPLPGQVPDLAIVIVNWNVCALLRENLQALAASEGAFTAEVIVVDNASPDDSCAMVAREAPWATLVQNARNLGFAKACNQGIAVSRARHVLLLNPDMRVRSDALARTAAYAEAHPTRGIFTALLLKEDDTPVPSLHRFPTFWSQFLVLTKLGRLFPQALAHYEARDLDLRQEQDVDSVRGAFLCIPERVLRVLGGLDERYFLWYEDVDYCRWAHQAGYSVRHVPSIEVYDRVGRSFAQRTLAWKQRRIADSMIRYFETWHPWWQAAILRIFAAGIVFLARVYERLFV